MVSVSYPYTPNSVRFQWPASGVVKPLPGAQHLTREEWAKRLLAGKTPEQIWAEENGRRPIYGDRAGMDRGIEVQNTLALGFDAARILAALDDVAALERKHDMQFWWGESDNEYGGGYMSIGGNIITPALRERVICAKDFLDRMTA
jgi:hypothetical protein